VADLSRKHLPLFILLFSLFSFTGVRLQNRTRPSRRPVVERTMNFQTAGNGGGQGDAGANSDHGSLAPNPLVDIEVNDVTRSEMVQIVVSWLIQQGFTSSAQMLREEATGQFRGEHYLRKTLRTLCRAVEESNWDSAQKSLKKLQTKAVVKSGLRTEGTSPAASLVRSLPFLLAQQQFLELIEEDNDQRSFTFFMRTIKPFERSISREHFQKLTYLLTCKTVAEGSSIYPEYRGWTAELGRAEILKQIRTQMGNVDYANYCRHGNVCMTTPVELTRPLSLVFQQSFSFELLARQHPEVMRHRQRAIITSLSAPLDAQLPATEPFVSIDVNALVRGAFPALAPGNPRQCLKLTACQPFLSHAAVVAATESGAVLWIPTGPVGGGDGSAALPSATASSSSAETWATEQPHILYQSKRPLRGVRRCGTKLLCWGSSQAVVLNLQSFVDDQAAGQNVDFVSSTFTHTADVYAGCFFPCGTLAATGLSEGTVVIWDLLTNAKLYEHLFSDCGVVALVANRTGSSYFAASKDGLIRVVDVATGIMTASFASPIAMDICSLAVSPSSTYLLTSYRGGTMRLWDILTGDMLPYRFTGTENNTKARSPTAFGNSDTEIFCGGEDGCLYYWSLRSRDRAAKSLASPPPPGDGARSSNLYLSLATYSGNLVHYSAQLPLHRSPITDVKVEGAFEVSCGEDGMIVLCTTCANASL
jgi:WD40 repeat protein